MGKEDFILDVNRAASLVVPPEVHADKPLTESDIQRAIYRGALWLTAKIVESYRREDFADLAPADQNELAQAVDSFRELATAVPPAASVAESQFRDGLERLTSLIAVTRKIVLDDWRPSFEKIVEDAENWSRANGWIVKRVSKPISDGFLGNYEVPQLHLAVGDAHLLFNVAGRFFPGTRGMAELSRLPTWETVMVPRTKQGWRVNLPADEGAVRQVAWNEESFRMAADWLCRQP